MIMLIKVLVVLFLVNFHVVVGETYFDFLIHAKRRLEYSDNFANSFSLLKSILDDTTNRISQRESPEMTNKLPIYRLRRPDFGLDRMHSGSQIISITDAAEKTQSVNGPG